MILWIATTYLNAIRNLGHVLDTYPTVLMTLWRMTMTLMVSVATLIPQLFEAILRCRIVNLLPFVSALFHLL